MSSMNEFFKTPKTKKSAMEESKSDKARPEGDVNYIKYRNYYDINGTITTAQATDPNDQDNVNYNQEQIFVSLERNAEKITVSNDGADTLFVIISHEGGQNFARERPIYSGENKTYFNVYELRLRSATQGLPYRITEYPICCIGSNAGAGQPFYITQTKTLMSSGTATLASLAANTEAMLVNALDVTTGTILEIQMTCTFGQATLGAAVYIYASVDGITYDTQSNADTIWVTAINMAMSSGNERTKTSAPIDVAGLNKLMIHVKNLDAAQALTSITIRYALYK